MSSIAGLWGLSRSTELASWYDTDVRARGHHWLKHTPGSNGWAAGVGVGARGKVTLWTALTLREDCQYMRNVHLIIICGYTVWRDILVSIKFGEAVIRKHWWILNLVILQKFKKPHQSFPQYYSIMHYLILIYDHA